LYLRHTMGHRSIHGSQTELTKEHLDWKTFILAPHPIQTHFATIDNHVIFTAIPPGGGVELWSTDGASEGTISLNKDIGNPGPLGVMNGKSLFFTYDENFALQLWISDGTTAGTLKVISIPSPVVSVSSIMNAGSKMYFILAQELWVTDGTSAGTRKTNIKFTEGYVQNHTSAGDILIFSTPGKIWATLGDNSAFQMIATGNVQSELYVIGNYVFF
jgi:ELWxxDGT repeat protein